MFKCFLTLSLLLLFLLQVVYSNDTVSDTTVLSEKVVDTENVPDTLVADYDSLADEKKAVTDSLIYPTPAAVEKADSLIGETEQLDEFVRVLPDSIEQLYLIGKSERCPSDMVLVSDTIYKFEIMGKKYFKEFKEFCIDRFEYPNLRGRFPEVGVTQHRAMRSCAERGKRLCSDREWTTACGTGINRYRFAYGNEYNQEKCNSASRMVERSGEFTDCRSKHGVFDMSGNVWEWTSGGGVGAYGGSHRDGRHTRCSTWKGLRIGYSDETVGFRCCAYPK